MFDNIADGEVRTFLGDFLGPWISQTTKQEDALAILWGWIEELGSRKPALLPFVRPDKSVDWYGIAFGDRQLRELGEQLTAFVGPTFSTFDGTLAIPDPENPADRAVIALVGERFLCFRMTGGKAKQRAILNLMLSLRKQANEQRRGTTVPRSATTIRRDFETALTQGNIAGAERFYTELHATGALDTANSLFLRVRLLAAAGNWTAVADLADSAGLRNIRLPGRIAESVIVAIYRTARPIREMPDEAEAPTLLECEERNDPVLALDVFRRLYQGHELLFRSHRGMRSPEALKGFMLAVAASSPPRIADRDAILAVYPADDNDRDYVDRLAALVPASEAEPDVEERVRTAFNAGDFGGARTILEDIEDEVERFRVLIACGRSMESMDALNVLVEVEPSVSKMAKDSVLADPACKRLWEKVQDEWIRADEEAQLNKVPRDWKEVIEYVRDHAYRPDAANRALKYVEQGMSEWKIEHYYSDRETLVVIEQLLEAAADRRDGWDDESRILLQDVAHGFLGFFLAGEQVQREFCSIYVALARLIAGDSRIGMVQLRSVHDLVAASLRVGIDRRTYQELVGTTVRDLWERNASFAHIDWALELLDTLVAYPAKDTPSRDSFFASVISSLRQRGIGNRLESYQWRLFELICLDYSHSDWFEELRQQWRFDEKQREREDLLTKWLSDKTLAIYTLMEAAAKRVGAALGQAFPDTRIEIRSDRDSSRQLEHLAATAEVFVIATRCAKHAATIAIDSHRPKGGITLFPEGKGSASILRAIFEKLPAIIEAEDA